MFYSHEVLTNRKYGVATVWLVATLGSKSSLKKVTRKQMLDVDVAKACKTIVDPVAPMALRLQSNLLYGVSCVYLQQCGYVLADAQSAHNAMMLMLRSVKDYSLDPAAGKGRPEQLVLQDDPSFLPDFALPPLELLADLDLSYSLGFSRSDQFQSLTPFGSQRSSQSSHVAGHGLVLPSSTPDRPVVVGLEGINGGQSGGAALNVDELLQLDEPDFTFGEDGDIIEFTPGQSTIVAPTTPAAAGEPSMHSDTEAIARVRQEHEEAQQRSERVLPGNQIEVDLPVYKNDMQAVEVTSPATVHQTSGYSRSIEASSSIAAPIHRKKRSSKALPKDTRLELRNSELLDWSANYLKNMNDAARSKIQRHIQQQAKKNAEHYVWGAGIGGIGRDPFGAQGPLKQYIGDNLFHMITGTSRKSDLTFKRNCDSGIEETTQEEVRRKRQKIVEPKEEIGRGHKDEGLFVLGADEEVELPREAGSALDDEQIFSAMPWNTSASKRGSSAIPPSGRGTMMSEPGRQGSRTGSRLVSASPLLRRSTGQISEFEILQHLDSDALDGEDFAYTAHTSDAAEAGKFVTQQSPRVLEALSAESENFFDFVIEAVIKKSSIALVDLSEMPNENQIGAMEVGHVTFEELLAPHETNKMVACQGFLMILSLGMKGMLDVHQGNAFEDITLKPTKKGKAIQTVEAQSAGKEE